MHRQYAFWQNSVFVEFAGDKVFQGRHGSLSLRTGRDDDNRCADGRRQHHQPHDGGAGHTLPVFAHNHIGIEAFCTFDKFCRSAGMQPPLIGNVDFTRERRQSIPQNLTGDIDVFPPCILGRSCGLVQIAVDANARQFHQHGQVKPRHHLNLALFQK